MANNNLTDAQKLELANDVVGMMETFVNASRICPQGYHAGNVTLEFYLGDRAGDIVGKWRLTVERLALD